MDISIINNYFIPVVVVFCLCLGYVLRNFIPTDNKWIPLILFAVGVVSGIIVGGVNYEAMVSGAVSGLASVGLNQAFKQALGLNVRADIELTEDEVIATELDEEANEAEEETEATEETEA
jgi:RsiW-degrading membrane proteinase PrsW (M82 family)